MNTTIPIPNSYRQEILTEIELPQFKDDLLKLKNERNYWEMLSFINNVLTSLFSFITILLLALKFYNYGTISSVLTASFQQFKSTSDTQAHDRTIKFGRLLTTIGVPNIFEDITSGNTLQLSRKIQTNNNSLTEHLI
jgi:hypothetical protein